MTWVKLDDHIDEHPKTEVAGPEAMWLFVCGLAYCNRTLTDGDIPKARLRKMTTSKRPDALARSLVDAGLWHDEGDHYTVHDYHDYQPSKEKVEAEREAARKRQEKFRQGRGGSNGVTPPVTSHSPTPDPVPDVGSTSDDDSPPPFLGESSSWTDAELYAEAGRICARDFAGTFRTTFDDYATGAAKAIRREKRHLVDRLRCFPLEQAAEIISRSDAETIVEIDAAFTEEFTPASEIPT